MSPPASRPGKPTREAKKAATREALLEAATKVFIREGYVAASVDDVAWEAGMTKGAVYSNFASKADLFAAVVARQSDRQLLEILGSVDPTEPATEQAALAGERFLAVRNPGMFRLTLEYALNASRLGEDHEPFQEHNRRVRNAIADAMESMMEAADFPMIMPSVDLVTAFWAIEGGVSLQELTNPDDVPDDLYIDMLTIFVNGLMSTPPEQLRVNAAN